MKKVFFLLLISLMSHIGFSQTIGDTPIEDLDVTYIEIVGTAKIFKPMEATIYVDYGQLSSFKDIRNELGVVKSINGEEMTFNGMMGALNFFGKYGYKLHTAYPISTSNSLVYHYILESE